MERLDEARFSDESTEKRKQIIIDIIEKINKAPEDFRAFLTKESKFFLVAKPQMCLLCESPLRVVTKARETRSITMFTQDQGALPGRVYRKSCFSCKAVYFP